LALHCIQGTQLNEHQIMPYYLDLTPRGNKKIDSKNKFNHDGGFQQKFQQKKPRN
jgi:hypothetical protein